MTNKQINQELRIKELEEKVDLLSKISSITESTVHTIIEILKLNRELWERKGFWARWWYGD